MSAGTDIDGIAGTGGIVGTVGIVVTGCAGATGAAFGIARGGGDRVSLR
ncbi:MAG TPA: hypothetical protein VFX37_03565 [Pseudolabrys sp.]|nr:hypothetical protein [Pseudolabrys sp.]